MLTSVDLYDPDGYVAGPPHEIFAELRRTQPVFFQEMTGEPGYSVLERVWARPTLEVHGIAGGFTAAGSKTVIPAKATAKVSFRLVPEQDPQQAIWFLATHDMDRPNAPRQGALASSGLGKHAFRNDSQSS